MRYSLTLASLVAAVTCLPQATPATPAPVDCKKLPTDSDWPSEQIWQTELKGHEKRGPQQAFTQPDYAYEASRVPHVQTAVKFAAKYNVRISIINSGHDFIARNDAPSGIKLTVGDLKGIRVLESFTPTAKGAEPVDKFTKTNTIKPVPGKAAAVTIGAGVNIDELNKALAQSGLYAIGAAHGEVAVSGGWLQAGGHGPLTSVHGLGIDNVLEFKVVTATGDLVVANEVVNQDLFWALRGGGPSTYGVVVETTVKAHPAPKILSYSFWLNTTDYNDHKSIFPAAAYLNSQLPRLNDKHGFMGYYYTYPNAISANWIIANEHADAKKIVAAFDPVLEKLVAFPGISAKSLIKIPPTGLAPSQTGDLQSADGGQNLTPGKLASGNLDTAKQPTTMPKMDGNAAHGHSRLARRHGPGEMSTISRGNVAMDSRLLGEAELTHPKLADALERALGNLPNAQLRSHLTAGGAVLKVADNATSVLPAWRKAYVHMIATSAIGEPNAQALRDISPNMGAYVNEAWTKNPNWKHDFWGSNYQRLAELKTKWDPNFVFYVTPGVGADQMVAKDGRLCKLKGEPVKMPNDMAPIGDNTNEGPHDKPVSTWPLLYQGPGLPPKANGLSKLGKGKGTAAMAKSS